MLRRSALCHKRTLLLGRASEAMKVGLCSEGLGKSRFLSFTMLVTFCNMREKGLTLSGVLRNVRKPTTVVPRP